MYSRIIVNRNFGMSQWNNKVWWTSNMISGKKYLKKNVGRMCTCMRVLIVDFCISFWNIYIMNGSLLVDHLVVGNSQLNEIKQYIRLHMRKGSTRRWAVLPKRPSHDSSHTAALLGKYKRGVTQTQWKGSMIKATVFGRNYLPGIPWQWCVRSRNPHLWWRYDKCTEINWDRVLCG